MTEEKLEQARGKYVLGLSGRLRGKTARQLNNRDLKWAISYNQRTIDWIDHPRRRWRHEERDGERDPRRGRTARQEWPDAVDRGRVRGICAYTLEILKAEQAARIAEYERKQEAAGAAAPAAPALDPEAVERFHREAEDLVADLEAAQAAIATFGDELRAVAERLMSRYKEVGG